MFWRINTNFLTESKRKRLDFRNGALSRFKVYICHVDLGVKCEFKKCLGKNGLLQIISDQKDGVTYRKSV